MNRRNTTLGIFAPYPRSEYRLDGWYRRIQMIDSIFQGIPRVYINTIHSPHKVSPVVYHPNGVKELFVNIRSKIYSPETVEILRSISLCYVHTSHIGEDFLRLNMEKPFIIDFHGVAPEEEFAQGNFIKSETLKEVESTLHRESVMNVYVSPGMKNHFYNKYGKHRLDLQLPIISDIKLSAFNASDALRRASNQSFVYSGGLQKWQNIEEMVEIAEQLKNPLIVATNQIDEFQKLYKKRSSTFITVGTYTSSELLKVYSESSFGYVLRDDSVVNRVAFPTKLYEYIASGVIPIVKFEDLGGLSELGIFTLPYSQLRSHNLSAGELADRRLKNFEISAKVAQDFVRGAISLRDFVVSFLFNRT